MLNELFSLLASKTNNNTSDQSNFFKTGNTSIRKLDIIEVLTKIKSSSKSINLIANALLPSNITKNPRIQTILSNVDDGTVDQIIDLVIKIIKEVKEKTTIDEETME